MQVHRDAFEAHFSSAGTLNNGTCVRYCFTCSTCPPIRLKDVLLPIFARAFCFSVVGPMHVVDTMTTSFCGPSLYHKQDWSRGRENLFIYAFCNLRVREQREVLHFIVDLSVRALRAFLSYFSSLCHSEILSFLSILWRNQSLSLCFRVLATSSSPYVVIR